MTTSVWRRVRAHVIVSVASSAGVRKDDAAAAAAAWVLADGRTGGRQGGRQVMSLERRHTWPNSLARMRRPLFAARQLQMCSRHHQHGRRR